MSVYWCTNCGEKIRHDDYGCPLPCKCQRRVVTLRVDPVTVVVMLIVGLFVALAGSDAILTGNHRRQQLCDETVGECSPHYAPPPVRERGEDIVP